MMSEIHACRGAGSHFVVAGVRVGRSKTERISQHKTMELAGARAGKTFDGGIWRHIWVNFCSDWYDSVCVISIKRPK